MQNTEGPQPASSAEPSRSSPSPAVLAVIHKADDLGRVFASAHGSPLAERVNLKWRVHTANLLHEILSNQTAWVLHQPMRIFGSILAEVGERAAELNDPKLNALMCRLTIYTCADPKSPDYDPELTRRVMDSENSVINKPSPQNP